VRRRAATLPYNNNNKHNNNTRARAASGRRCTSRDEAAGRAATAYRLCHGNSRPRGVFYGNSRRHGRMDAPTASAWENIDKIVF